MASLKLLSLQSEEMTVSLTKDPAPHREGLFSNIQKTEDQLKKIRAQVLLINLIAEA